MDIKIGVSARHVHLTKGDLEYLFGKNYELTPLKILTQKDTYSKETISIKTNKGQFDNVRIIGPVRDYTQIEISKTDSYFLGLNPPVRASGNIKGSESITLVNGDRELYKEEGCIIADRHIHLNYDEAKKYGLVNGQKVKVKISGEKGGILDNVSIKINDRYTMELHIDLDDANAHLVNNQDEGEIIINERI